MITKLIKNYLIPPEGKWTIDLLSGITVALALIPASIAFALLARVDPLVGLFSAFIICIITAIFGGRPGMISGAAGAMAVVSVSVVVQHGVKYLFATIILTGIFQIIIGIFRLGKFVRIIPKPVMVGFVNGLAIIVFISQLDQFKTSVDGVSHWITGYPLYLMIGLALLAMTITHFIPQLTKKLPSALIAIFTITAIVHLFHLDTRFVGDMMSGKELSTTLPIFAWLDIPWDFNTLKIILPYALMLSIVGISESLLTLSLIDEMTNTRGRTNKECIAQGLGNIVCGFFQGMGGCAMIGQSMINIKSGGRGRLSGIVSGITLLFCIIFFWPILKLIPLAALAGVMFMIVIETFEWATFKFIRKIPKKDAFIIVLVTLMTVFANLAISVITGVIIAALVFVWDISKNIYADKEINANGSKIYKLHGPLFFGSASHFKTIFEIDADPEDVIIDFLHSRVTDHSAIDAILFVSERYTNQGKKLHLRHLTPECKGLLGKAGTLMESDKGEDPDYHVVSDVLG